MARKVILDVDTGVDDALALLLALRSPELEVLGVTCVAGNVTIDLVTRNTLATLELLGDDVPVAIGARKPLVAPLRTATYFHGANGLAGIDLPPPRQSPIGEDAASFMARLVKELPGEVTVVAVGPMTNVALAVLRDPQFVRNVAGLVLMGGAVHHPGNATSAAEANFSNDPEAAGAVVRSGAPIQLVDLGATSQAVLPLARLASPRSGSLSTVPDFALELLQFYGPVCTAVGAAGAILHDPLALALAARPDLCRFVPLHLDVETSGTQTRGACVATFSPLVADTQMLDDRYDVTGLQRVTFNASIARQIDVPGFLQLFLDRLELG